MMNGNGAALRMLRRVQVIAILTANWYAPRNGLEKRRLCCMQNIAGCSDHLHPNDFD